MAFFIARRERVSSWRVEELVCDGMRQRIMVKMEYRGKRILVGVLFSIISEFWFSSDVVCG